MNCENEKWVAIDGFDMYEVSTLGRIRNKKSNKILIVDKSYIRLRGYCKLGLIDNEGIRKKCLVHRVVAKAFIPNPMNLPLVNHKDENKLNNDVSNLEWCDASYNSNYGTARLRAKETRKNNKLNKELCKV
jgi:hypothetical protein